MENPKRIPHWSSRWSPRLEDSALITGWHALETKNGETGERKANEQTYKAHTMKLGLWHACTSLLLMVAGRHGVLGQACDAKTGKCDTHQRCPVWADEGECNASRSYMLEHCPGSCAEKDMTKKKEKRRAQLQAEVACEDKHDRCSVWASVGECESNPEKMHEQCPFSCGICLGECSDRAVDDCWCL